MILCSYYVQIFCKIGRSSKVAHETLNILNYDITESFIVPIYNCIIRYLLIIIAVKYTF